MDTFYIKDKTSCRSIFHTKKGSWNVLIDNKKKLLVKRHNKSYIQQSGIMQYAYYIG